MISHNFYITPEEYEQAERNGIDAHNLERRVRLLGWKKERAMTQPLLTFISRGDWPKVAEENGISYAAFASRIARGWTFEDAATKPLITIKERTVLAQQAREYRRIYPAELIELAKKNGISYRAFHQRVKTYGWPLEKAATHPLVTSSESGKRRARIWAENRRKQKDTEQN